MISSPSADYSLSEFSVIFHLHHIRFHYGETCGGVWGRDIYYHTPKPADGILLLMVRALDSILHETGSERDARSRPLLMAIREQLRHELELAASRTSSPCHPVLLRVRGFLENNFHCGINCSTVCDELNINRSYASTLFHHEFGISMSDYLLHLRMNAAKFLLSSRQELKIAEIADYCGFQDPNYFIRVFRQQTEMTPGKYRDLHKPKN